MLTALGVCLAAWVPASVVTAVILGGLGHHPRPPLWSLTEGLWVGLWAGSPHLQSPHLQSPHLQGRLAFHGGKLWLIDVSSGPVSWLLLPPSFSWLHGEKLPGVMEEVSSQAYPNSIPSTSLHALSPHGKSLNFCEPQLLHL